ncbi:MAG: hypothetical protein VB031_07655 [Eubacteriaceae bacterium]|nr:hypothetical protein [Eubacteriaceae bacterium]
MAKESIALYEGGITEDTVEYVSTYGDENVYHLNVDGVKSEVTVDENSNGGLVYNFNENGLKNEVILKEGKVYLDGKEVTAVNEDGMEMNADMSTKSMENLNTSGVAVPMATGSTSWNTSKCPYGKKSQYTKYVKSSNCADLKLRTMLQDIGVGALATILGIITGFHGLEGFIYGAAIEYLKYAYPTSTHASYKAKLYYHKNGSWVGGMKVVQYRTTWYGKAKYTGKSKSTTTYRCTVVN